MGYSPWDGKGWHMTEDQLSLSTTSGESSQQEQSSPRVPHSFLLHKLGWKEFRM